MPPTTKRERAEKPNDIFHRTFIKLSTLIQILGRCFFLRGHHTKFIQRFIRTKCCFEALILALWKPNPSDNQSNIYCQFPKEEIRKSFSCEQSVEGLHFLIITLLLSFYIKIIIQLEIGVQFQQLIFAVKQSVYICYSCLSSKASL